MSSANNVIIRNLKRLLKNEQIPLRKNNFIRVTENEETKIIIFNSLSWNRTEYVKIAINRRDVEIKLNNIRISSQINQIPNWRRGNETVFIFEIFFKVNILALGFETYTISVIRNKQLENSFKKMDFNNNYLNDFNIDVNF